LASKREWLDLSESCIETIAMANARDPSKFFGHLIGVDARREIGRGEREAMSWFDV
jgi:hypothetical protein